jgi:hypothetical protein
VAFYTFDGNGNNSAGSGLNLTGNSITYQSGLFGQAAVFNGQSSYMQTAESFPILGSTSRTIDVWLNANSYWGFRNILVWGDLGPDNTRYALYLEPPTSGRAYTSAHWNDFESSSYPNSYGTGQWFNLAATFDGTTRTTSFYLNGAYIGGSSVLGDPSLISTTSGPLTVGNNDTRYAPYSDVWFAPWDGMMDNLRIYNRVLSADEIAQLATVPEPSTLMLLSGFGFALISSRTRRAS